MKKVFKYFNALIIAALICGGCKQPSGSSVSPDYNGVVTYSQFGAKGDGVTDDSQAIINTHNYANENNYIVKADRGARYYIGLNNVCAVVKTDCDWDGAEFIIDDTGLNAGNKRDDIFCVKPSIEETYLVDSSGRHPQYAPGLNRVSKNASNLGIRLEYKSVVYLEDKNTKRFKRILNGEETEGTPQCDVIVIDKNGKIDKGTPLNWDYNGITTATFIPIDEKKLTIKGGTFITRINDYGGSLYVKGGIRIERSNVTVSGITHRLENEDLTYSAPYYGIFYITKCSDVTIKDCKVSSHKTYVNRSGTYDIYPISAVHLTLSGCTEVTDYLDMTRWGVIGSNFCKDVKIYNCTLSRFDAHQGVTNVFIKNSHFGQGGINIIGEGNFRIEDSSNYGQNYFINLRRDFGSSWKGKIYIKNCTWYPRIDVESFSSSMACIIGGTNGWDFDFGYECYMPEIIVIDGFKIVDDRGNGGYKGPNLLCNFTTSYTDPSFEASHSATPYHKTEKIYFRRFVSTTGKPGYNKISDNMVMFENVEVIADWTSEP